MSGLTSYTPEEKETIFRYRSGRIIRTVFVDPWDPIEVAPDGTTYGGSNGAPIDGDILPAIEYLANYGPVTISQLSRASYLTRRNRRA